MNAAPSITLDAERHIYYRADGVQVPGVTRVLERFSAIEYRGVDPAVMENAADIGRKVHKLIELDARDDLDEASIDERLQVYFLQWRQFRACSGFRPAMSEQIVYSARYGFAGTLDLLGRLHDRTVLIDAKRTALVPRTAGPQTAAYKIAVREEFSSIFGGQPIDRYALHLAPHGWRLVPLTDPNDERVFLAALTCHKWEQQQ